MSEQSGRWKVTLGETVFVVVVLFFVVGVLLPALCRVKTIPYGPRCGTQLAGLGKAMLIYANDYDDRLPLAGGPDASRVARTPTWMAQDRFEAYGIAPNSPTAGQASMSASLYLLVKYTEVKPDSFLCRDSKGNFEKGASVFDPSAYGVRDRDLTDLWDFGPNPPEHVSFAYHMGYGSHNLTTSREAGTPVAADRNPWMDSPFAKARPFSEFTPSVAPFSGTEEAALLGNSPAHQGDGQNVLFLDSHVEFAKRPYCGVDDDNVYTAWKGDDKLRGNPAQFDSVPADPKDALLVNDPAVAAQAR